tara:strand:+ start:1221 stop:1400 length:180 start_codon:yes stop_codon:yes gene_type:complete
LLSGVSINTTPEGEIELQLPLGEKMTDFYTMTMNDIHGEPTPLQKFSDTACLVVNVASR